MNDGIQLTFGQLLGFMRRGLLLASIVAIVSALALYQWRNHRGLTYEAQASLVVQSPQIDLRNFGLPQIDSAPLHVDAYRVVAASSDVLSAALKSLNLPASPTAVDALRDEHLHVQALPEARVIKIIVTDSSPGGAAELANAIASQLQSWDASRIVDEFQRVSRLLQERITIQQLTVQASAADGGSAAASNQQTLSGLRSQLDTIVAMSANATSALKVLYRASPPTTTTGSTPAMLAILGVILGATLGYGFMFVTELFSGRYYTAGAIERGTGVTVLAEVPRPKHGRTTNLDAVATLQTNLDRVFEPGSHIALLVVGIDSSVDTATAAAALAEGFALRGAETLLVDADLRHPELASRYRLPNSRDLSLLTFVQGRESTRRPLQVRVSEGLEMALLCEFKPAPQESLLLVDKLLTYLGAWKRDYHAVIVRTSLFPATSDALALSKSCDGVLLVVNPRSSSRQHVAAAVNRLTQAKIRLVGIIATISTMESGPRQGPRVEVAADISTRHTVAKS